MKIVSLINMKGGVGKTTVAVNLADFLVNVEGKRVLLIDVDPQFNATQCVMGAQAYIDYISGGGYTVVDIFDSTIRTKTSIVTGAEKQEPINLDEIRPIHSERGFDFVPGNLQLFKLEIAPGSGRENRLKIYAQKQQDNYDYVIIDSPPTPSVWMSSALIASNYYLIPVKPDPLSMTGIDLLQGIINEKKENYGFDCKCCGIILTMVEKNSRCIQEAQNYFDSKNRWKGYVYSRHLLKRVALSRGQLNDIYIRNINDSDLKAEFSAIVKEFLRRTK